MRVGIIGATGLIGKALAAEFHRHGHEVIAYSRRGTGKVAEVVEWRKYVGKSTDLTGLDVLVSLAGFPVNCRWTQGNRQKIVESRIGVTRDVVEILSIMSPEERPKRLVIGTGISIYGERGDERLSETSPATGTDFLAQVVKDWEAEAWRAKALGMAVHCIRTGMVLGREAQAWKQLKAVYSLGIGGKLGSGQQWMAWIHLDDLARIFAWVSEGNTKAEIINGVAPMPERNVDFTKKLAKQLRRPAIFAVPKLALKLVMGGFGEQLTLSLRVIPVAAVEGGFEFRYENLESALAELTQA